MKQRRLTTEDNPEPRSNRGGPPNRMNDLSYSDWMKFQKSFFRFKSTQHLIEGFIHFFTKAVWPDGSPSRSLIIGCPGFDRTTIDSPRQVLHMPDHLRPAEQVDALAKVRDEGQVDFAVVDLRTEVTGIDPLLIVENGRSDMFFSALRAVMKEERYCCVLVDLPGPGGAGFPTPWAVALSSRDHLRLRDEKIGLVEDRNRVFYCIFLQSLDDDQAAVSLTRSSIETAEPAVAIPAWTIPKPPPRKKNEVLHPAKYPETLVGEFIELFTKPGERVLDPMVGTGSTVVAAHRMRRHGYGIDLMRKYVETAQQRVGAETLPMAFGDEVERLESVVIQGDATQLSRIDGLPNVSFDYAVTSPPYWSMLQNPGSEYQRGRREQDLPLVYSDAEQDLGNVGDYGHFIELLEKVYNGVAARLSDGGHLTVVVKNVKRDHIIYPLAWDVVRVLCSPEGVYDYVGTTLWCQDDVGLKPFAVGTHWVSNTLHHYCLHFRKRSAS